MTPRAGSVDAAESADLDSKLALTPPKPEAPSVPLVGGKEPLDLLDVELPGFVPLFNGKDLTGWKPHPDAKGYWHVERGVLIGSGLKMSHLFTERGDFSNFHLRVKAKINDGGDGGVFFRTQFGPGRPQGYEAQINCTQAHLNKTGSLFASTDTLVSVGESWAAPDRPFWLEVVAEGNHVVVKVDGKTTADYTDDKRRFTSGHIALQQWDPRTVIEFHKIEIKESGPRDQDKPAMELAKKVADAKPVVGSDQPGNEGDKLTAQEALTMREHTGGVTRVVFHPTLPLLASAGKDGRVLLWNLAAKAGPSEFVEFGKFREEVWAVKFNTTGELLTFANRNWWGSVVSFKNVLTRQEIKVLRDFKNGGGAVASIAYSPDDQFFAAGQDDGTIRLWHAQSPKEIAPVTVGGGNSVFSLDFGPVNVDRKRKRSEYLLAAACKHGLVKLLSVTLDAKSGCTFEPTSVQFPPGEGVIGVRFSPNGKLLGTTRWRGLINLYDPHTGVSARQMQASGGSAEWISFHPKRPWCVTAHSNDRLARIWNTETGEQLCELRGHDGGVFCAEFSPDGQRVATASDDFSIKLWDLAGPGVPAVPARSKAKSGPKKTTKRKTQ